MTMVFFGFLLSLHALAAHAHTDVSLKSSVADVTIRVFGEASPSSELVICIPGMSTDLVYEWATIAEPLSEQGYHVVIVNLHGAQRKLRAAQMSELVYAHIVKKHFGREKYTLLGKSWGGAMALEMAMMNPTTIHKLALIAPAGGSRLIPLFLGMKEVETMPLFLGWAEDDTITASWKMSEWTSKRTIVTKKIPSGGHTVNSEYAEAISNFLRAEA